ncbi:hypothetical protein CR513_03889, partial [Mucuna pruriens]
MTKAGTRSIGVTMRKVVAYHGLKFAIARPPMWISPYERDISLSKSYPPIRVQLRCMQLLNESLASPKKGDQWDDRFWGLEESEQEVGYPKTCWPGAALYNMGPIALVSPDYEGVYLLLLFLKHVENSYKLPIKIYALPFVKVKTLFKLEGKINKKLPCRVGSPTLRSYVFLDALGNVLHHIVVYINLFLLSMTRSGLGNLHAYDPEIDRTFCRLRNSRSNEEYLCISNPANSADSNFDLGSFGASSDSNFGVTISQFGLDNMENNDKTLKELATPDVMYQPWCLQYPGSEQSWSYELKLATPDFHGLAGEDPHKHLKEFHAMCSTMRPHGIPKDYIKMKAFPFSLDGAAKDWLYLQPVLFNAWGDMKRMFLEKFFPISRIAAIRKDICGIRQHIGETLYEY